MKKLTSAVLVCLSLGAAIATATGCNTFGDVDHATTQEELLEEGKAALDAGDCDRALAAANAIGNYADATLNLQGWAALCKARVTINSVGKTLFNYDANDPNNYQILGKLANEIIPAGGEELEQTRRAINYFGGIQNPELKGTNLVLAYLAKASVLIAARSSDHVKTRRADIYSSSACVGATCSGIPGTCAAGMSDADANDVADAFSKAATASALVQQLAALRAFAQQLGNNTGLPNVTRCTIVNNILSE